MRPPTDTMTLLLERLGILSFVSLYLVVFNINVPHGDALRIARQIEANELIWNPNHLLLDPFGYVWHSLLQALGANVSILNSFELISALSTLIALYLFHKILLQLGVRQTGIRILAVLALFASKNFLSLAVSQYFFMLQMPFLLGAFYFAVRFAEDTKNNDDASIPLYGMGLCMALATAVEINNLVPTFFIGFVLAFIATSERPWNFNNTLKFWIAAAVVGFPIFLYGYYASPADSSFISWLLAYQGESNSSLDSYYGTQMNLGSIVSSGATLVFHLFFGNFIETAGLGTVVKVLVTQQPLEFIPDTSKLILAGLLMPVVGLGLLLLFIWSIRHAKQVFLVRLCLTWLAAYLLFNFFWPYTSDLFWFQLLPLIWLLLVIHLGVTHAYAEDADRRRLGLHQWKLVLLSFSIVGLLILNTLQTVVPLARADIRENSLRHQSMLQKHDMEIIPGWDNYKWMMQEKHSDTSVHKLLLMNMALKSDTDPRHIKKLPQIIVQHLASGHRVIVGRLYDRDRESNPWYGLADLGWSRQKIQSLLDGFCRRRLDNIDDVGFYELYSCDKATDEQDQ